MEEIKGFSKLSKLEKINLLVDRYFSGSSTVAEQIKSFWHDDNTLQQVFDDFSENTLTNFFAPYGVVPNVSINGKTYSVPMVIEESSVVAAAAKSAKFWMKRGGFHAEVVSTNKIGQVHLSFKGESDELKNCFERNKADILVSLASITKNMEARGGGVLKFELRDKTDIEPDYYQLWLEFETCDAMGANFINSVLEAIGTEFSHRVERDLGEPLEVIMAILSNYTPDCRVKCHVECDVEDLNDPGLGMSAEEFAHKFTRAVRIAQIDVNRATTHNKGIFNGIDAVILATGNDFRAVEACGHTYAARDGQYRSLSRAEVKNGKFRFELDIPFAVGTVGGLTSLHPLAKLSLDILGRPEARELMMITAAVGLAQNFGAVRSLTTTGIQQGHMKMHLMNILNHLEANESEREVAKKEFDTRAVSFNGVREFLTCIR